MVYTDNIPKSKNLILWFHKPLQGPQITHTIFENNNIVNNSKISELSVI